MSDYRHTADRIARDLGGLRLEDVSPEMLERWKTTLTASSRTVAKYLVVLHGIFRRAMKVWRLPRNPVAEVERPRFRVSDDIDAFSPEDVHALVRAAGSSQDACLYLTAAFTGLRLGELLALQWRDVDFTGEAIRVRRSYNVHGGVGTPKSGKVRSVPMVAEVAQARALGRARLVHGPTRTWSSRATSASISMPQRCATATRPHSIAPAYVGCASTISGTGSERSRYARRRSRRSRLGWGTRTSGRRCATSTTATVATRRSCSQRRSLRGAPSQWPKHPPSTGRTDP
jgi:integrase